jgi:hypothetical protein
MISFRVSENEFEALRTRAEAQGVQSLSEYARLALRESTGAPATRIEPNLSQLSLQVQRLSLDVRRLADLLDRPRPLPINGHPSAQIGNGTDG